MATDRQLPPSAPEGDDVNVTAVWVFGAGMLLAAIVLYVLLGQLFAVFTGREALAGAVHRYPVAAEPREPPEPRLQRNPRQDLRDFRAREDAILGTYGWIDPAAGIVRIPIEEAMKITAQRGLPARRSPGGGR
jgi:hypothetical protein